MGKILPLLITCAIAFIVGIIFTIIISSSDSDPTPTEIYLKVTNSYENHRGFQYKTGLNLREDQSPDLDSAPYGFHYTNAESLYLYTYIGCKMRIVRLPTKSEHSKVQVKESFKGTWETNALVLEGTLSLGNISTYEYLESLGAELTNYNPFLILTCANDVLDIEMIKFFLEKKMIDMSGSGMRFIKMAVEQNKADIVELLLPIVSPYMSQQFYRSEILSQAAEIAGSKGLIDIVRILLNYKAQEHETERDLRLSVLKGGNSVDSEEIVDHLLIEHQMDPVLMLLFTSANSGGNRSHILYNYIRNLCINDIIPEYKCSIGKILSKPYQNRIHLDLVRNFFLHGEVSHILLLVEVKCITDTEVSTFLQYVLKANRHDVLNLMLKNPRFIFNFDNAIDWSLGIDTNPMLGRLLNASKDVSVPTLNRVLANSIEKSDEELALESIKHGADPNSEVVVEYLLNKESYHYQTVRIIKVLIRNGLNRETMKKVILKMNNLSYYFNLDREFFNMIF